MYHYLSNIQFTDFVKSIHPYKSIKRLISLFGKKKIEQEEADENISQIKTRTFFPNNVANLVCHTSII